MADGHDIYRSLSRGQSAKRRRRKRRGIHIKPSHRGLLRRSTKTKKGRKIPLATLQRLKNSSDPAVRRRATFALNARSWGH